jgi:hypothetical protein
MPLVPAEEIKSAPDVALSAIVVPTATLVLCHFGHIVILSEALPAGSPAAGGQAGKNLSFAIQLPSRKAGLHAFFVRYVRPM